MCCFYIYFLWMQYDSNHNAQNNIFAGCNPPPHPSSSTVTLSSVSFLCLTTSLKSHSFIISPPPLETGPSSSLLSLSLSLTLGPKLSTRGTGVHNLCCQICDKDNDPPPPPLLCPPSSACQPRHHLHRCPTPAGGGPSLPCKIPPPQRCGQHSSHPMLVPPLPSLPLLPPPLPSLPLLSYCHCHCCCRRHCLC
jgi:hypothetical protein